MKRIFTICIVGSLCLCANSQTLTSTSNEPITGNVNTNREYDSTAAIPRNTGANQTWNFNMLTVGNPTAVNSYTFVAPSSVPESTAFPTATTFMKFGNNHTAYRSVGSPTPMFESLGMVNGGTVINYTNTLIEVKWPMTMGTSFSDTYAGNMIDPNFTITITGTMVSTGSGSGIITLPNGQVIGNVLQVMTTMTNVTSIFSGTFALTTTITGVAYSYFSAQTKFPLLTVGYTTNYDMSGTTKEVQILVNQLQTVGVAEFSAVKDLLIYPNPSNKGINIHAELDKPSAARIELFSAEGKLVRSIDCGTVPAIETRLNTTDLSPGTYFIKVVAGSTELTRQVIVE
jgi:hypothetical protein